jgi:hypothetical protein
LIVEIWNIKNGVIEMVIIELGSSKNIISQSWAYLKNYHHL